MKACGRPQVPLGLPGFDFFPFSMPRRGDPDNRAGPRQQMLRIPGSDLSDPPISRVRRCSGFQGNAIDSLGPSTNRSTKIGRAPFAWTRV